MVAVEKFAKMGPQTLAFVVLPLVPHFIGTYGPTVSFSSNITIFSAMEYEYRSKEQWVGHLDGSPSRLALIGKA